MNRREKRKMKNEKRNKYFFRCSKYNKTIFSTINTNARIVNILWSNYI